MKVFWKILVLVIVLAVLAGAGWMVYNYYSTGEERVFRTEKVGRGDLMSVISSSGTVEPEELVNVGAQVSGKIMNFGTDGEGKSVDYGSKVKKGMLLAQIDDYKHQIALEVSSAQLNYEAARQRTDVARRQVESAREDYRMALMRYKANVGTNLDVLDARTALTNARTQLVDAVYDTDSARATLDYALGVSERFRLEEPETKK